MPSHEKSNWEKTDILIKGLLPIAVAAVGYWGTSYLAERERTQATERFYTELLTKREDADSSLRKEMFAYVIDKFLGQTQDNLENQVLGLELLAYNFHDSIALGPLFKAVYKTTLKNGPKGSDAQERLERVSNEITDRQIASLADADHRWGARIDSFEEMRKPNFSSVKVLNKDLPAPEHASKSDAYKSLNLLLEALSVDKEKRAVRVRIQIRSEKQNFVDATFMVSYFDFPMLDNIKLPNRQRLAVVLREFGADSAELMVVYFPENRASLKEKPYLDDLIEDYRRRSKSESSFSLGAIGHR